MTNKTNTPNRATDPEGSESHERRSHVTLERHIQTILISVCTGALFFAANYIYTGNEAKAVQKTQLEALTTQVIEMRADLKALQNNYVRKEEFREMEIRVRQLERQKP